MTEKQTATPQKIFQVLNTMRAYVYSYWLGWPFSKRPIAGQWWRGRNDRILPRKLQPVLNCLKSYFFLLQL